MKFMNFEKDNAKILVAMLSVYVRDRVKMI